MYALREALKGMRRTAHMTVLSVATMTVTLVMLGLFAALTVVAHGVFQSLQQSEEINVYLRDGLSDEDMLALDAAIASMSEVASTRILSKEDAAREFNDMFGEDLLGALGNNPLPRTIVVRLAESEDMAASLGRVADRISDATGVESVEYAREWMSRVEVFYMIFLLGETVLSAMIVAACIFIISNTISLTIIARRDTVHIMRLVGATNSFIRRPFYYEGTIQGLTAGVLAFGVLYGGYIWMVSMFPAIVTYGHLWSMPSWAGFAGSWSLGFIMPAGAFLGLVGSYVAISRTV